VSPRPVCAAPVCEQATREARRRPIALHSATPHLRCAAASHPSLAVLRRRSSLSTRPTCPHYDSAQSLRPARHAALLIHICPTLPSVDEHVYHSVPGPVVPWSESSGHRGQRRGDLPSVHGEPVRRSILQGRLGRPQGRHHVRGRPGLQTCRPKAVHLRQRPVVQGLRVPALHPIC